jgi:ribosomal-protein-alanine N-acetyltransferase
MAEAVDRTRAAFELGPLRYGDLPAVQEIERAAFPAPWSLGMFATELAKPSSIRIAARGGGELIGYLICSRYADVWHLMNVAVAPSWRRRGVGTSLVRELIGRLEPRARVTLEVRESNRGAISMYEALGFRAAGLRPGYYPDNGEPAVLMWLNPPRGEW